MKIENTDIGLRIETAGSEVLYRRIGDSDWHTGDVILLTEGAYELSVNGNVHNISVSRLPTAAEKLKSGFILG